MLTLPENRTVFSFEQEIAFLRHTGCEFSARLSMFGVVKELPRAEGGKLHMSVLIVALELWSNNVPRFHRCDKVRRDAPLRAETGKYQMTSESFRKSFLFIYGHYLEMVGRVDDAIQITKRGLELDPNSRVLNSELGWAYYFARRDAEAVTQLLRTLERIRVSASRTNTSAPIRARGKNQ
jgi:tetratricopeptide (TPR) repeat protein